MPHKARAVSLCKKAGTWAVIALSAWIVMAQGDALWRRLAPHWPGGGYGFAASAGFLIVVTWTLAGTVYRHARQAAPLSPEGAGLWGLTVLAYVSAMPSTAALLSLFPGRNGALLGEVFQDGPMWVEARPEVCWAILPGLVAGAAVVAIPAAFGVPRATGRRRQDGNT